MGPRSSTTSSSSAPRVDAAAQSSLPPRPAVASGTILSEATRRRELTDRDMRSKRPPVLTLLMRMTTVIRVARVASLLALDFAGVALAIFTALVLKEALHGHVNTANAMHGTKQFLPFAYLLTALLFAR